MTPWTVILRKAAQDRSYLISKHAHQRMGQRCVSEEELAKCLSQGVELETQDHGRDIKVLLQGTDSNGKGFYIVAALSYPRPVVVTVCRFRDEAWEELDLRKEDKGE